MDALRPVTRRNVAGGLAASAAALALPRPALPQSAARIIVIGGGFGGASCARALRRLDPKLQVTLIEPNRSFTACPFSNEVIAGLREIEAQQFGYHKIVAEGITVIGEATNEVRKVGSAGDPDRGTLASASRAAATPDRGAGNRHLRRTGREIASAPNGG